MTEQIRATKVVVRKLIDRRIKVMYLEANVYELIVDNEQTIQYISPSLKELVLKEGSVKFVNSIATVVLTHEDGVVLAAFTTRILEQLIAEPLHEDKLDVMLFRAEPDDAGTICDRSQTYAKIESELKKRRNDLIKLSKTTPVDKALIEALDKTFAMIELAKGEISATNNLFFGARKD